jgi:pyruvate dehydrogenase E1 component alpha subunit
MGLEEKSAAPSAEQPVNSSRSALDLNARMLAMLRKMHIIRAFEEAAGQEWHSGNVRGSVHQYVGQEAIAVGVCANLRTDDYISSNHRGHGHSIAKGADPVGMMKELFGRVGGTCGGKGGSMHIADFSIGMLGANGVVADGVTIAVGAGHAIKILKQDRIVVPFFGDGAVNRGPLMESLNWSRIYNLPVLYVCEHNGYAATTRTADVTAGEGFVARARSFGIEGEEVDGNDIQAVDEAARHLAARVRGQGPAFLFARTYRHHPHNLRDSGSYRTQDEIDRWKLKDPILLATSWLLEKGTTRDEIEAVEKDANVLIVAALAEARSAPWPAPSDALTNVQDLGAPQ